MKLNPTIPLRYYRQEASYHAETGQEVAWVPILTHALYAEWRGGHGDQSLAAQAVGVSDMATVRTFYHPTLCAALRDARVLVVKNGDESAVTGGVPDYANPSLYELWGGVDDVGEAHQYMEFRVRRYEPK